jgi:hypothetical protein
LLGLKYKPNKFLSKKWEMYFKEQIMSVHTNNIVIYKTKKADVAMNVILHKFKV